MRLDKFLKLSRLVKRRTVANEFCDVGGVKINGRAAKASTEVNVGDELVMAFGNKTLTVKVLIVPAKPPSVQEAPTLYEVVSEVWADRKAPPEDLPSY